MNQIYLLSMLLFKTINYDVTMTCIDDVTMFRFNLVVRRTVESLVTLVSLLLNIRKRW
jgi:hypothetical protein